MSNVKNLCSSKVSYDLKFEIVSLDINDGKSKINCDTLSVKIRFAEKMFEINLGDDVTRDVKVENDGKLMTEEKPLSEESKEQRAASDELLSETEKPNSEKTNENLTKQRDRPDSESVNESVIESMNDGDDDATDESQIFQKTKSLIKNSKLRQRSQLERSTQFPSDTHLNSTFGSKKQRFDCTPCCMSEKLANHCIKYEVLQNDGQLIGLFLLSLLRLTKIIKL